jgi:hypothetical protein
VDSLFYIGLPVGWEPFESDRFRAKTIDGKTQISITNWITNENCAFDEKTFRESNLPLYKKFVDEGEYEPYDDLIANDKYISKSFKVDAETQYYLTTANNIGDKFLRTDFIIRDIGDYDHKMRRLLQVIMASMKFTGNGESHLP